MKSSVFGDHSVYKALYHDMNRFNLVIAVVVGVGLCTLRLSPTTKEKTIMSLPKFVCSVSKMSCWDFNETLRH